MITKTVLITGGAGYIGSHAVLAFREAGWQPVVLDNLSTGSRKGLFSGVPFIEADVADSAAVTAAIRQYQIKTIVHFAGSIVVPESITNPLKYYDNNSSASRTLIATAVTEGIKAFVFSSTAAVYGDAQQIPIAEDAALLPINPYGRSKLATEFVLQDVAAAHPLQTGILRYFNVAGADPSLTTGQRSKQATHLIKVACEVAQGKRPALAIFGTDYPTADGTCIRDYIHVRDLADAHVLAADHLLAQRGNLLLNCGYGQGYSVRDVIRAIEAETGKPLPIHETPRRAGDPAALVADNQKIKTLLNWQPRYNSLQYIVRTALDWEAHLG